MHRLRPPHHRLAAVGPRVVAAVLALVVAGGSFSGRARAQTEIDPTGGLRDKVGPAAEPVGASREELVRKWDLDGNGTIDPAEAAVARGRMRRSRMELQLNSVIDPLTGRPRVMEGADVEADLPPDVPPEPPAEPRKRSADGPDLPGTRVPDVRPVPSARTPPAAAAAANAGTAGPSSRTPPSRPGTATGGVRAGAPAARPGYGSLAPRGELNAGRPRSETASDRRPTTAAAVPDGRGLPRGGLLPTPRSGRIAQPQVGPPPTNGRPANTSPLLPRTPRITADEIGGF